VKRALGSNSYRFQASVDAVAVADDVVTEVITKTIDDSLLLVTQSKFLLAS